MTKSVTAGINPIGFAPGCLRKLSASMSSAITTTLTVVYNKSEVLSIVKIRQHEICLLVDRHTFCVIREIVVK